jgi:hypothetical protein
MAQKLRDDKIGTLSQSSGIITMSASTSIPVYLTIGGQQYKVTSNLSRTISTDLTMTANSLYMIYAVRNSGNTELRVSANVNSIGPAGFSSWILVGAFYANGLLTPSFGSFVNITGAPTSEWMDFNGIVTASPTSPTKGTISSEKWKWRRVVDSIEIFWDTVYVTAGTAGSGQYLHSLPLNLTIDATKQGFGGNFVNFKCGTFSINATGVSTSIGYIMGISSGQLGGVTYNGNILGSAFAAYSNAAYNFSFNATVPITGFNNSQLKDL